MKNIAASSEDVAGDPDDLLTTTEICAILNCPRRDLIRWTKNTGKYSIKFPQPDILIAGKRRWKRKTLLEWMESDHYGAVQGTYWERYATKNSFAWLKEKFKEQA